MNTVLMEDRMQIDLLAAPLSGTCLDGDYQSGMSSGGCEGLDEGGDSAYNNIKCPWHNS